MKRRHKRRAARALDARNRHTVAIHGHRGIYRLIGREIWPVPLTNYTFWVRRGYWRIFHISHYDLVD